MAGEGRITRPVRPAKATFPDEPRLEAAMGDIYRRLPEPAVRTEAAIRAIIREILVEEDLIEED